MTANYAKYTKQAETSTSSVEAPAPILKGKKMATDFTEQAEPAYMMRREEIVTEDNDRYDPLAQEAQADARLGDTKGDSMRPSGRVKSRKSG